MRDSRKAGSGQEVLGLVVVWDLVDSMVSLSR